MKTRVRIKTYHNSGGRTSWTKTLTKIDHSKNNGYAFVGKFLTNYAEYDLEIGTVLISCNPEGSAKSGYKSGHVYVVNETGYQEVEETKGQVLDWHKNFLSIKDIAEKYLNSRVEVNPLLQFTDLEIKKEFLRRKITITVADMATPLNEIN